jgi:hypothetical protein
MATCASCGNEGAEGVTFCKHCGQEMTPDGFTTYAVKDPSTGPLFAVRIGRYIETGWNTFLKYPAGFVGFILILALVTTLLLPIYSKTWIPLLWYLLSALLEPLLAGIFVVSAKLLQRQTCAFIDFFGGLHYFQPLLIFGLINSLFSMSGELFGHYRLVSVLFNLASLAFMLAFLFTPMLVIDRRMRLWEAMGLSRRTVQRRWLSFLGLTCLLWLFLVVIGLSMSLMVVLVSGVFKFKLAGFTTLSVISVRLTTPFYYIVFTAAYADLFGFQSKEY